MATETADEAQALLSSMETRRYRDGIVERAEVTEIPVEFFDTLSNTVMEQLTLARNAALRDYPELAANSVANRLIRDGVITQENSTTVRNLVELEIRRGIELLSSGARDRFAARLPITLRLLIPLITRRSGTK